MYDKKNALEMFLYPRSDGPLHPQAFTGPAVTRILARVDANDDNRDDAAPHALERPCADDP
jgi:hypothetical protein